MRETKSGRHCTPAGITRLMVLMALGACKDGDVAQGETAPAHTSAKATSAATGAPSASASPSVSARSRAAGSAELDVSPGGADSAVPESAQTLPNVKSCIGPCVERNRMRSVGADTIDADCKKQCKAVCLKHCQVGSTSAKAACRTDCERQTGRIR